MSDGYEPASEQASPKYLTEAFAIVRGRRSGAHSGGTDRRQSQYGDPVFRELREIIAARLAEEVPFLDGEIEVDESYFGGRRKGKRGRGATGKVPVFGLLKRGGKVHAVMIPDGKSRTLIGIIRQPIKSDSIVYTDSFGSYDILDVSEFHHHGINHSEVLRSNATTSMVSRTSGTKQGGISQATTDIPKAQFHLLLKECEWRFNHRPASNLLSTPRKWAEV